MRVVGFGDPRRVIGFVSVGVIFFVRRIFSGLVFDVGRVGLYCAGYRRRSSGNGDSGHGSFHGN